VAAGARPLRLWLARRLHDYSHLEHQKGPGVRPWILEGDELGRGPDNEPLVGNVRPVAWLADDMVAESERIMQEQNAEWGPLHRPIQGADPPAPLLILLSGPTGHAAAATRKPVAARCAG
jgi:hypothetical protein